MAGIDIDHLIIGAAAAGVSSVAKSYRGETNPDKSLEKTYARVWSSDLIPPDVGCREEREIEWYREVVDRINKCANCLVPLYAAINFQGGTGACYELEEDLAEMPYALKDFYPFKPGVSHSKPSTSKFEKPVYFLDALTSTAIVDLNKEIDSGIGTFADSAENYLKFTRERYWVPNPERWEKWQGFALKLQGKSEQNIWLALCSKNYLFNSPANDVVYRTPEELVWYDKIVEHILAITRQIDKDSYDWARMCRGKEPTERFLNEHNYMSMDQYADLLLDD